MAGGAPALQLIATKIHSGSTSVQNEKSVSATRRCNGREATARLSKPARDARALPGPETYSLHIRVRAFAVFGDEAVDPRGDDWQRH
jgi:hypothetical protein